MFWAIYTWALSFLGLKEVVWHYCSVEARSPRTFLSLCLMSPWGLWPGFGRFRGGALLLRHLHIPQLHLQNAGWWHSLQVSWSAMPRKSMTNLLHVFWWPGIKWNASANLMDVGLGAKMWGASWSPARWTLRIALLPGLMEKGGCRFPCPGLEVAGTQGLCALAELVSLCLV